MESYWYQCPACGMTHQVPAYWMSYSPEPVYEFPHVSLSSGTMCECVEMLYAKNRGDDRI